VQSRRITANADVRALAISPWHDKCPAADGLLRAGAADESVMLGCQYGGPPMTHQITVHLLDSAQGHPLQTWSFEDHDSLTLGRAPDNDIVVADPYVSRAHAYLKFDGREWRLISLSRQMIFYEGDSWPEVPVGDGTVCRLGPHGCYLRFGQAREHDSQRATMSFDATLMPVFKLDRDKMQKEVSQIADAPYFQQLKDAARAQREKRRMDAS
jgi:hypothetical protein